MTTSQSPEPLEETPTGARTMTPLEASRDSRTLKKNGLAVHLWFQALILLGLAHSAAAQAPQVEQPPYEPSPVQQPSVRPPWAQPTPDHPVPKQEKPGWPYIVPVGVCGSSFPGHSYTLNVPPYYGKRPPVAGDYIAIEYNANQDPTDPTHNLTSWTDYNHNIGQIIQPNGSFLPVVYTKEKIAVQVCGLHFTDVLTVTTSPNGVPEGGADIRGATAVTPPASLSGTLDMLQSGTPTGGTTTQPGLGLGAPAQLPSLSVSGITPGSLSEDQTPLKYPSYTPTAVTASGRQVVLLLYSVVRNAQELKRLIDRTFGKPYTKTDGDAGQTGNAPGSVNGVKYILNKILDQVKVDAQDRSNYVAFDQHLTDIQNTNAQISTLASALSSQAFASNALALLNNFSTLEGVLDLANLAETQDNCSGERPTLHPEPLTNDDLSKLSLENVGNLTLSQVLPLSDEQIKLIPDKVKDAEGRTVQDRVRSYRDALRALGLGEPLSAAGDKPLCSAFEKQRADDFWKSFGTQGPLLVAQTDPNDRKCVGTRENFPTEYLNGPEDFEHFAACTLRVLNEDLGDLRTSLGEIDLSTMQLYDRMNEWYFESSVEQTDLLPPLTSNAFARISIVVQRGFTPFTLANASGTFTATTTTNVPAAASAANTSTPAHAVKTILVEVHRLANFNIEGGAMFIHIPTASYAIQAAPSPAPPTSSGASTYTATCGPTTAPVTATVSTASYGCVVQTQQTDWQLAAMAGLVWFPWGHDYFPRRNGFANYGRNLLPSVLIATSVSTLGNSMIGVNWEPISGIDFSAGLGSAHRTVLPSGLMVNTPVASMTTLSTVTQEHAGFTFGFGIDLSVFTTIFGAKTGVASQP